MKTFDINIMKKVIGELIDKDKYFKFTVKNAVKGRPDKLKGNVQTVFGNPYNGLSIHFSKLFFNKKHMIKNISITYKSIRWIENPFTKEFEDRCEVLQKEYNNKLIY